MARTATVLLALLTLSSLRSTTGRSLGNKGGSNRAWTAELGRGARAGGRVVGRGRADSFVFADGRRLGDDPACPTDCVKCSSIGECLQCTNSKYLNPLVWTCEEICPMGFYPEGTGASNRTCTPCAADCAKCNSASECVQCKNSKYLSPAGACGFSCPPGYQKHGDDVTGGTCWPCPPRCRACTDWYTCDVCETGAYLLPNRTCLEQCDDGYFRDDSGKTAETGGVCTECYETCSKCTGRATCQECQQSTYLSRVDHMCRATCEDGYYPKGLVEVGNTCEACPSSCALCTSPERCSVCSEGYFLTPNETCDESCPDGYYGNSTLGTCESCPNFCDRCSDSNTCTDCMKSKTLTAAGTCEFVCPEGFYKNGTGTIGDSCQPCPTGCARCIAGMFSPVVCLECGDYNYLTHRGECVQNCPEGYYPQGGDGPLGGVCVPCEATCAACISPKVCTKCTVLHFLTPEASCELDCPRGWTEQGGMDLKEPGVCVPCSDNCGACQSLQVCEECKNFYYLHQGSCMKSCPVHYYEVEVPQWQGEGRHCRSCRVNDYACSSPNAKVGTDPDPSLTLVAESCQNDFYLYDGACHPKALCPVGTFPRRGMDGAQAPGNYIGGECVDCPENCYSCSSPQRCTECKYNTYLSADMACIATCPSGFFEVGTAERGRTCQPCSANCGECQSGQFCTKCMGGAYLTPDFTCEAQCPDGYYPRNSPDGSTEGRTCQKCLGDCLTCETRYSCTKCKNSALLTHKKECMPECPPTHYPDGSEGEEGRYCIECPGSCSECAGPYNCTQCKTPTFLTAHGTCESSCQEGYHSDVGRDVHTYWGLKVGGTCKSCPENCNRCLGSGCIECNKFTYLDANGECTERCPDGYFGSGTDELGRVCKPCSASHGVCLNSTYVLECGDNLYLDPWNVTCLETCPDGYFGLEGEAKEENGPKIGGTCEKCLGTCKACSSATVCKVCWTGSYLNPRTGKCSMTCPRDHYMSGLSPVGRECLPCPANAGRCVNETYIFECSGDNQYLVPGGGNCTASCPDGYFGRPGVQLEEDGPLVGGTCEQCVGNCKLCKSATECLQCQGGTFFDPVNLKCSFDCPSDFYMTGFGEDDRACKPCAANAARCVNDTFATQCRGDQQYLVPAGGKCTSTCPEKYFGRPGVAMEEDGPLIGGTCDICVAPCETCTSATECLTCKGGTYLNPKDFGCRFDCPPDTYMKGAGEVGRICAICPAPFYGCLNDTYALSCRGDNYYLTPQHTCQPDCPEGYYKEPGVAAYEGGPMIGGTCRKCVENCKACYSVTQCTACHNGAYFNARDEKCDFSCLEDQYMFGEDEEGRICKPCPPNFHSCINEEHATHCKGDNLYLTKKGTCVSTCPTGYWRRPSNITAANGMLVGGTCEACVGDCKECLTEKECTVCENNKFLKNGTCVATCPAGYWPKSGGDVATCELCSIGTAKCKVASKGASLVALLGSAQGAEAVECDPGCELKSGDCENPCARGQYKDVEADKCVPCPGNCTACMTADKCTECGPGFYLDKSLLPAESVCRPQCPDGFFTDGKEGEGGGQCTACSTSCMQCADKDQCLLCKDVRYLAPNPAKGEVTCEDTCPSGYYPNGTNATGRNCPMCGNNCQICLSASQCGLCANGKYLIADGWCEDGCPEGYYGKGEGQTGRTCELCPGDFFSCVNAKLGTECRNGKYLTETGTCESSCPDGTYHAGTGDLGRHCLPCDRNCASCLEGNLCLQCTGSHYLTPDGWCEASCPDGYYKNGSAITGRNCALCPDNALSCISPSEMTECRNYKYLTSAGICEDTCPNGTYPEGRSAVGRSCQVCNANCELCTQANVCQRCKNGMYLSRDMWCEVSCPDGYYRNGTEDAGRSCLRCPENAMKCIGPTLISECRDGLYLTPEGTCAPSCAEGTYPLGTNSVGRRCESCSDDCVHCTRENVCLQCRNGKYLTPDFWCEATCPPGTWKNYTGALGSRCEPCPGDVGACINATYATECKNAKYLTREANCKDSCPNGYFPRGNGEVGRHCPQCHDDCFSCSTTNVCTVCDNGKFLSPNMWCDETCPDGYYRNGTEKIGNTCPQCSKHASKCINGTHAIECQNSRYLNPDFTCEVDCPRGLYQNGVTAVGRVCSLCAENCTLCVNGTTCTECRNNRYLSPDFWCEEECPSDHYYKPAPSLQEIEWKKLPDQSCGGSRILTWSGGGDSQYGQQYVDNLAGCQLLCMARAECAGFELREDINRCSFWKAAPLAPKAAKGVHCYRKMRLAEKKDSRPASEVVLPAWGKASMSSSLDTTLPSKCNDGLVGTRCSSAWNEAAGELYPWWQMDLGDTETMVKIRVLSDPDGCEALSEKDTGLHCSILGGVVGVSKTPCAAGKNCSGTVCGTLKEPGEDKWFEIDCDRAAGQYVYLQLPGYRVLNFRELVAFKVAEHETCVETWQLTNVLQSGDTFAAANQEGGSSFALAGPVTSVAFKPGQDDRPVWVGLTTDPADERDYQDGKYIHLTSKGTINIDGAQASMTYTPEDYIRLELKGKELIIFKNGAAIHAYDLGSSTSLHGWFALIWFGDTGSNEPGAFVEQVQTGCLPPQDGVGGTCILCPGHASRCVNGSIALECKNDMYLTRTHECSPDCPHGDYPTDGWYGVGGYCTQCHENCNTCVNATTCLECKNQHYLTHDFKCVPECAKGYYEVKSEKWDDGLGGLCKQCHENCSACNSETECTECRLYTYRTDSATCTDTCPDTYYKNGTEMIGGECLPCGENCFECESDVTCKVCNSSYFLARTGECVEHCPDGDYEFGAEELGRQCMKCPDDFNKCITATYASECKNNLYLNADAQCVASCPDGHYHRPLHSKPIGNVCPVCPGDCNKCEDASTCTECKNTMYLNPDFWCELECPVGYYKVGNAEVGNTCAKCPANCRTCIDAETCTECTNFKYLAPSRECVEVCPNNTFPQGEAETGRACPHCEKNCHMCESATLCLQCNNSMHLDDMDNCVVTCPDGYYPEGAEDRGRTCESCPMSFCGICTGPDVCLECTESRYLNPDSTCRTECPDGFYRHGEEDTGRICPRCFHTCNKCDSADICKECKNFTYLTPDSKCNYECPPGYYEHGTEEVGGTCRLCSDNCVECTGALVCEVCKNNYFLDPTSSTCKTACPAGWYQNIPDETVDTGRTCEQCPAPCNRCNSALECTECKDSAFLTPFGTCEYTCPPGLFPFGVGEINITCQPCSPDCDTCDTYEVCTACKNDKFLNPDGACRDICPDGYWQLPAPGGVGNACPLCSENCSLCTSPTVCQECRNSTYLSHYNWCEDECQDGYFEEGVNDLGRVCKVCPPTCNKCEAEDHCTECKYSTFLTHYQACETTCPPGYYPNRTRAVGGVCETCPDECSQCSTSSTCSECRNGLYLTPSGWCEETCPEGHYTVDGTGGVGGTCPMCPENCQACNSAEECTVCRGFTHLTEYNQCRSECPSGYYENGTDSVGGNCNRCPRPCNLCETASVCTECAEASYLTPSGSCEHKCPDRYHFEGTEEIGRFCKSCPPTCFNCHSQERCTECQNFTFLTPDEKCEYTCPDGSYRLGTNEMGNTCPPCPENMKRCISATYATECSNKKYLTPSATCDEGCPDGYFRHGDGEVGRTCPMCAQNCTVCTNATTCQGCKNGQYLTHTHWCDHECPDGYYKFGTGDEGRVCKVCHSTCNTCLGPEVCTECKQGTYLAPDGSCQQDCPEGYYKLQGTDGVGGTCPICPHNCAECAAEKQCTICANSTYLHDSQCKPRCPDGWYHNGEDAWNRECLPCTRGCSQCTEQHFCTECKDGLFLNPDATCASTCPDGFFQLPGEGGVGGVCQLCAENCTKCDWWDRCQECKASRYLTHYQWCDEDCPAGYYEEGDGEVGRLCLQCPETCNLCEGPAHCTECKNSTYLTSLKQCKGECPVGFFHEGFRDVGRTCQPCERNCHQCVSSTECIECKNSTFLTAQQDCAEACPPGYYGQGEDIVGNTCQKCSKDCALCDALENCLECTNSTYLAKDKYCVEECSTGYIETGDTLSGRFCDDLCFWCE